MKFCIHAFVDGESFSGCFSFCLKYKCLFMKNKKKRKLNTSDDDNLNLSIFYYIYII